jgi:ABC-type dipeptide/oligopeptide/nickel transport system ATPase subunit
MRIKRLEYHDHARGWKLEPVEFSNLNLLVGVSGAGKTQILNAILNLKKIANGESLNGVEWDIKFLAADDQEYHWQGEFETKKIVSSIFADNKESFKIIREELSLNNEKIVDRSHIETKFKNNLTPKLSPFQSITKILNEEDAIAPVKYNFRKIIEGSQEFSPSLSKALTSLLYEISTINKSKSRKQNSDIEIPNNNYDLQAILDKDISAVGKLTLVHDYFPDTFSEIKNYFIDIFPQIEDIAIESFKIDEGDKESSENSMIQIKERGNQDWIDEENISAGMFKTLMYIAQFYLSPKNSVILIDEFENSLGVNCIDAVTDIITERQDLQVIITSHHPYIINNISMGYWKIVTRKGSVVTVKSAEDLHLGRSKHQAYLQLINKLERYNEELESV